MENHVKIFSHLAAKHTREHDEKKTEKRRNRICTSDKWSFLVNWRWRKQSLIIHYMRIEVSSSAYVNINKSSMAYGMACYVLYTDGRDCGENEWNDMRMLKKSW